MKEGTYGIPVFVMLPLDASPTDELLWQLQRLHEMGARGVMFDMWWGICEPEPGIYDFSRYLAIMRMCREIGLCCQVVAAWHACGGNVGDCVNIPLPSWVLDLESTVPDLFYMDQRGNKSRECISLSCDNTPVFPNHRGRTVRTALDCYADFLWELRRAARECIADGTLLEVQVGMGPCGELRYPSYPMAQGWIYPGIGAFQCYDPGMLADMTTHLGRTVPPSNAGDYNNRPDETSFFWSRGRPSMHVDTPCDTYRSPSGRRFLEWYSGALLAHAARMLETARLVFPEKDPLTGRLKLSVKIAGVHWLAGHGSRAAEKTAGYYGDYFKRIGGVVGRFGAIFNFTCLEMYRDAQPAEAMSRPEKLVQEAVHAAKVAGVRFAGENALPVGYAGSYEQVIKQLARAISVEGASVVGFTLLRLTDELVAHDSHAARTFGHFVHMMGCIPLSPSEPMASFCLCKQCIESRHNHGGPGLRSTSLEDFGKGSVVFHLDELRAIMSANHKRLWDMPTNRMLTGATIQEMDEEESQLGNDTAGPVAKSVKLSVFA